MFYHSVRFRGERERGEERSATIIKIMRNLFMVAQIVSVHFYVISQAIVECSLQRIVPNPIHGIQDPHMCNIIHQMWNLLQIRLADNFWWLTFWIRPARRWIHRWEQWRMWTLHGQGCSLGSANTSSSASRECTIAAERMVESKQWGTSNPWSRASGRLAPSRDPCCVCGSHHHNQRDHLDRVNYMTGMHNSSSSQNSWSVSWSNNWT